MVFLACVIPPVPVGRPRAPTVRAALIRRSDPPRPAPITAAGVWSGRYHYADGQPSVEFNALIDDVAGALFGDIDEIATFGDGAEPRLFARLDGERNGYEVLFLKSYDGTAGVEHSVQYVGRLSADMRTIRGEWRIFSRIGGTFDMTRQGTAPVLRAALMTVGAEGLAEPVR
jgi:hypothetical protein